VRIVLFLAVAVLVLTVLLPLLRRPMVRDAARPPARIGDELVKDPVCQTYVVRSRAVRGRGAEGAPYFCSEECARRYAG
jgi:YHS domain-containing protein